MSDVAHKVCEAVANACGRDVDAVKPADTLEDLGLDYVAIEQLVDDINEVLDVQIASEDASVDTVAELIRAVREAGNPF